MKYSYILINICFASAHIDSFHGNSGTALQTRHFSTQQYSTTILRRSDSSSEQSSSGDRRGSRQGPSRKPRTKTSTVQGTPRAGEVSGYATVKGPGSIVSHGFEPINISPGRSHTHTVHSSQAIRLEAAAYGSPPTNADTQPDKDRAVRIKTYGQTVQGSVEVPSKGRGSYKLDAPGKFVYDRLAPGKHEYHQHKSPDSSEAILSVDTDRGGKASASATNS